MTNMVDTYFDQRLAQIELQAAGLESGLGSAVKDGPEVQLFVEVVEEAETRLAHVLTTLESMETGVAGQTAIGDARTGAHSVVNLLTKPLAVPDVGDVAKNHVRSAIGGIEAALLGIGKLEVAPGSMGQTAPVNPIRGDIAKLIEEVPAEQAATRGALFDASLELEQLSSGSATKKTLTRAFDALERASTSLDPATIDDEVRASLVTRIGSVQADVATVTPSSLFAAPTGPLREQLQGAQLDLLHAKTEARRGDVFSIVDTIMDTMKAAIAKNAPHIPKV